MAAKVRAAAFLTIAGSDSGAGAGLQADARTIQALGGYALTVATAVTAQNTRGVRAWRAVPPWLIGAQLEAVLGDFKVLSVKTGLLPGPAAIRTIAAVLKRAPRRPLVVDPVVGSTSGTRFLSPASLRVLKRQLLPLASLVTPNWPEAAALAGRPVRTPAEAAAAGVSLAAECGCAVLVKGGHGPGRICRDCLVLPDGRIRWQSGRRIATRNTHGTGCVLSSAIAFHLGRRLPLEKAVLEARRTLRRGLKRGRGLRWGSGAGPAFANLGRPAERP